MQALEEDQQKQRLLQKKHMTSVVTPTSSRRRAFEESRKRQRELENAVKQSNDLQLEQAWSYETYSSRIPTPATSHRIYYQPPPPPSMLSRKSSPTRPMSQPANRELSPSSLSTASLTVQMPQTQRDAEQPKIVMPVGIASWMGEELDIKAVMQTGRDKGSGDSEATPISAAAEKQHHLPSPIQEVVEHKTSEVDAEGIGSLVSLDLRDSEIIGALKAAAHVSQQPSVPPPSIPADHAPLVGDHLITTPRPKTSGMEEHGDTATPSLTSKPNAAVIATGEAVTSQGASSSIAAPGTSMIIKTVAPKDESIVKAEAPTQLPIGVKPPPRINAAPRGNIAKTEVNPNTAAGKPSMDAAKSTMSSAFPKIQGLQPPPTTTTTTTTTTTARSTKTARGDDGGAQSAREDLSGRSSGDSMVRGHF